MAAQVTALTDDDFTAEEVSLPVLSDADFTSDEVTVPALTDDDFSPDEVTMPSISETLKTAESEGFFDASAAPVENASQLLESAVDPTAMTPTGEERAKLEIGPAGAAVRSFAKAVLPAAGGAGAAAATLPLATSLAPFTYGASYLIPLVAGYFGGTGAGKAQEAILDAGRSVDQIQGRQEKEAELRSEFPMATTAGELAPQLAMFRPSASLNLLNRGVNAAVGAAQDVAAKAATGEEITAKGVLTNAALGALLDKPTAIGRAMGFSDVATVTPENVAKYQSEVAKHLETVSEDALKSAAADPEARKSLPYDPALIDTEIARRSAPPDVQQQASEIAAIAPETTKAVLESGVTPEPPVVISEDVAAVPAAKGPAVPTEAVKAADPLAEVSSVAPESKVAELAPPDPARPATEAPIEAPASGAKLGPGAANAEEVLASYEQRRFGQRLQEDASIDPAIREATGNRYYEPIPNKVTVRDAEAIIEKRGTDESVKLVRDESFPMEPRVRSTMAQGLIKKLNQSYQEAKRANDPKADDFLTQAADTAEYLSEMGTRMGQGIQAFSIWSRLSPEGMLMAAKRTVKKGVTEFEVQNGEAVQQVLDTVNFAPPEQRVQVLIRLSKDNIVAKKVKGDFEKIADAAKDGNLTKDQFYTLTSEKLGVPTLTPEQIRKITDYAAEIEKTPEGFQRDDKTRELLSFMSELKGANPSDIPTALWYSNILSGFTTQLVNTADTAVNVLSESAAMALANPKSAPQIVTGLYQGFMKGIPDAAYVLKEGKGRAETKLSVPSVLERTKFGEKGGVPMRSNTALTSIMKSALESKPASVLNLWKFPLRAMVASDAIFYNSFKEARARVLAQALGKKEGLAGDALFQRVDEILNTRPQDRAAGVQTATGEGLSGIKAKKRINEIMEQRRPEELLSNADEAAQIATYNHDPVGIVGMLAHHLATIVDNIPGGKFIVPFTRIVANVTNRGLDYSPYGFKRLFFGRGGGKRFSEPAPVGEAYKMQLAKATAGTVGMVGLAALDAGGQIQVSANGPDDPGERSQLRANGWKPFSVKVGDTYYSYQNTPAGLGFAIVGQYRDAIRYNKLDQKDAQTRVAYALLNSAKTITDMSFLSGLSDFMDIVNAKGSSTKSATNFLSRTASSVAVPNIIKQINKLFDPTAYQADTIQQALIRDTPIATLAIKPQLNMLGEPVRGSVNRFTSADKKDPVWSLITEKQAFISVPSKTTKIKGKAITPDQYYALIQKSGPKIRSYIQSNLGRFKGMEAQKVQEEVEQQVTSIRTSVKAGL